MKNRIVILAVVGLLVFTSSVASAEANTNELIAQGLLYLKKGEYQSAIAVLSDALVTAPPETKPRVVELLGLAHERSGHDARARAVYEQYLLENPQSDQVMLIQQRLDALMGRAVTSSQQLQEVSPTKGIGEAVEQQQTVLSQYYFGTKTGKEDRYDYFNSDLSSHWRRKTAEQEHFVSFRAEGSFDNDQTEVQKDFRLRKAFYRFDNSLLGTSASFGRQNGDSVGLSGDIDGVNVAQRVYPGVSVQASYGVQVTRYELDHYDDQRRVAFLATRFGDAKGMNFVETYLARRTLESIENRLAVGATAAANNKSYSIRGSIDYDLKFSILNMLSMQSQYLPSNRAVLYASADFRRTPFVSLENAMWYVDRSLSLQERIEKEGIAKLIEEARLNTGSSRYVSAGGNYNFPSGYSAELSVARSAYRYSFPDTFNGGRLGFDQSQDDVTIALNSNTVFGKSIAAGIRARAVIADGYDSQQVSFQLRHSFNSAFRVAPRLTVSRRSATEGNDTRVIEPSVALDYQRKTTFARIEAGYAQTRYQADELETIERSFLSCSLVTQF